MIVDLSTVYDRLRRHSMYIVQVIHVLTLVMLVLQTDHYLNWLSLKVFFLSYLARQSSVYSDYNSD